MAHLPMPDRPAQQPGLSQAIVARAIGLLSLSIFIVFSACSPSYDGRTPTAPRQLVLVPQHDGLDFPQDAAWSPDGTRIAILGRTAPLAPSDSGPHVVNTYDATSGTLMAQLHPDPLVQTSITAALQSAAATPSSAASSALQSIDFVHVLWSPTGQRLALTFVVFTGQPLPRLDGLVVATPDGKQPQVLLHSHDLTPMPTVWDVSTGSLAPSSPLPPALGYQWATGGTLAPATPLNASTPPAQPAAGQIGTPDAAPSFTIWQPGQVALQLTNPTNNSPQITVPGVYTWLTDFAAWSPDGRYLLADMSIFGQLQPSHRQLPSAQTLVQFRLDHAPLLPVRDTALEQLLLAMPPDSPGASYSVAWRPDGRVLAIQVEVFDSRGNPSQSAVTFYETAHGAKIGSLSPAAQGASFQNAANLLRWSRDGTRLLIFDHSFGTVTIWGSGLLPSDA